jgi:capsular exopolysaccharide synthesis family protein
LSRFFKALQQAARDRARKADRTAESAQTVGTEDIGEITLGDPVTASEPLSASDAEPVVDLPVRDTQTGPVAIDMNKIDRHLVSLVSPQSDGAEQFLALRHIVEQWRQVPGRTILGVSSPGVGDGKTITTINLAGALAKGHGARVLLVEADLRRPSILQHLGAINLGVNGLVDFILDQRLTFESVVTICSPFNFAVLPAGRSHASSYELLKSNRMVAILQEARQRYDCILVDMPPLVPLPDCRVISSLVDGLLLVIAAHKTPRKLLEEAFDVLEPSKLIGIIFNRDDRLIRGYRNYYRVDQPSNGDVSALPNGGSTSQSGVNRIRRFIEKASKRN